jgi:hypothetical protein
MRLNEICVNKGLVLKKKSERATGSDHLPEFLSTVSIQTQDGKVLLESRSDLKYTKKEGLKQAADKLLEKARADERITNYTRSAIQDTRSSIAFIEEHAQAYAMKVKRQTMRVGGPDHMPLFSGTISLHDKEDRIVISGKSSRVHASKKKAITEAADALWKRIDDQTKYQLHYSNVVETPTQKIPIMTEKKPTMMDLIFYS